MSSDGGSPRRGGDSRRDSRSPEKDTDDARKSPDEGPDEENNRTIFCGNIDDRDGEQEIRGWFEKYGTVDRVDMKGKFAFVYMPSKRCAEKAIKELDRTNPGGGLALRVEFTRGDGETKRREEARKAEAMSNPTKTLFLANFDAQGTRSSQLEEAFGEFGKVRGADIRKNFAFIDFDTVEEAIKAKEALNGKQMFGGSAIVVEYKAARGGGGGGGGGGGYRGGGGGGRDRYDRDRYDGGRDRDRYRPRSRSRDRDHRRDDRDSDRRRSRSRDRDYRRDDRDRDYDRRRDDRDRRRNSRSRSRGRRY